MAKENVQKSVLDQLNMWFNSLSESAKDDPVFTIDFSPRELIQSVKDQTEIGKKLATAVRERMEKPQAVAILRETFGKKAVDQGGFDGDCG